MMRISSILHKVTLIAVIVGSLFLSCAAKKETEELTLVKVHDFLKTREFVDLTHSFDQTIPHWPGFPSSKRDTLYWYEEGVGSEGSGFFAEYFSHVGQWGTHCDPPNHFAKGKRSIEYVRKKDSFLNTPTICEKFKFILPINFHSFLLCSLFHSEFCVLCCVFCC